MYKYFLILLLFINTSLLAQTKAEQVISDTVYAPVEEKETEVIIKSEKYYDDEEENENIDTILTYHSLSLSIDTINALKNDKRYKWNLNLDSLLRDAKNKELNKPKPKVEPYKPRKKNWFAGFANSSFFTFFIVALAILFVGFIVYQLFISDGAFSRKSKKANQVTEDKEEIVELNTESDFDKQIRLALEQRNYRLAIRYQYLKSLHLLSEKRLIFLSADKTNFDYVNELINHPQRNPFAALTLNYDYVWYGEFDIDEIIYRKIETNFTHFNNSI